MKPLARLGHSAIASGNGSHVALDEGDLCVKLQAYFQCRCRHVDPPAPVAEAWDRFYQLYAPRVRAFLRRFALPEADRDDCLQEVWIKVLTRLALLPYDPRRTRLSAWLMTVARNQAVDALRRHRRLNAELIDDAHAVVDANRGPAAVCDRHWTQTRVQIVLAELSAEVPALSFQVLYMRTIKGCSTAEVAEILGLTREQVRFRLHRMKRKFRARFQHSAAPDRSEGDQDSPRNGDEILAQRRGPSCV
jgi:RNA polymerase sigma-70 factor (ECF subfamily)